jgi:lipopolysaccharide/colanic/teichoic acid biosynthesis glycosyltransferase
VSPFLIVIGLALLWLAKQAIGPLIGQQISGSVPDYATRKAREAARLLPSDVAADYEEVWLAELQALGGKPLSALQYARGLRSAARSITAEISGEATGSRWWGAMSRTLDVNTGVLLLLLLAPLLGAIGFALRLDNRGPSLVRWTRLGKGGESFGLFRFRTVSLLDAHLSLIPIVHTRVGRFLEQSSLDLMPCLFNLLRGDMSLIGPPPQRPGSEPLEPLPVRPGVFSWQVLVEQAGVSGLDMQEARRRDRQRTFRSDMALLSRLPRFAFLKI